MKRIAEQLKDRYMKFFIRVLLIVFCLPLQDSIAQQDNGTAILSHYIFSEFSNGKILFKSGKVVEQQLNYNALTGEMVFDNGGGNYLAISDPATVDTVTIQGRQFVPVNKKFYEVLTHSATPLFHEYACTIKEQGANIGYGMSSTTTASSTLNTLIQNGGAYNLKLPDGFKVEATSTYWIFKDGKFQKANNAQQIGRVFPDKKAAIKDWVKKNDTDFSKREDIIKLVTGIQ